MKWPSTTCQVITTQLTTWAATHKTEKKNELKNILITSSQYPHPRPWQLMKLPQRQPKTPHSLTKKCKLTMTMLIKNTTNPLLVQIWIVTWHNRNIIQKTVLDSSAMDISRHKSSRNCKITALLQEKVRFRGMHACWTHYQNLLQLSNLHTNS